MSRQCSAERMLNTSFVESFSNPVSRLAVAEPFLQRASLSARETGPIKFNKRLLRDFLEIARLYFYDGGAAQRHNRLWFVLLVIALFLGVIGLSFYILKLLVMILTYFKCHSIASVLSQGVTPALDSDVVQIVAGVFMVATVLMGLTQKKYIAGKLKQWGMLGAILFFALLVSRQIVLFSYISRSIENTLHEKSEDSFYEVLLRYGVLLCVAMVCWALNRYTRLKLARHWRKFLTELLAQRYMAHKIYYRLNSNSCNVEIDNPDQRMTEDVDYFTEESLGFLLDVLSSIMNLLGFAGVLWSISPQLMGTLLIYAALGSLVAAFMGKRLIVINYEQLHREADLRYSCIRVREHAESIAFYNGESLELDSIFNKFQLVLQVLDRFIRWESAVQTFTSSFIFLSRLVPYLAIAPLYFRGEVEFGTIAQSQIAFQMVLNSVDFIVRRISSISKFAAGIKRLSEFYSATGAEKETPLEGSNGQSSHSVVDTHERLELTFISEASPEGCKMRGSRIKSTATSDGSVRISQMTLMTPTGRTLVRDLSCSVPSRTSHGSSSTLLVVGASGTGKSSILRAIAGLWKFGVGQIHRPVPREVMFLPQKPYMPLGNLRVQLIYPHTSTKASDEELTCLLHKFNLGELPSRFTEGYDSIQDWSRVLSLGEQQRVAAVRCLLFSSSLRLVVLDEATSALPVTDEHVLYGLLKECGVSIISVGHRESLLQHHDLVLRLKGDGAWELEASMENPDDDMLCTSKLPTIL